MPRYLGIDYGRKRIGLAVSDADALIASPLQHVLSGGLPAKATEQIQKVVEEYEIEVIVMGLPLMMDDSEGEQARATRKFGDALARQLDLPVEYWDERLSSHTADELLDQRVELTNKRRQARRDALAAQTILQGFLDNRRD